MKLLCFLFFSGRTLFCLVFISNATAGHREHNADGICSEKVCFWMIATFPPAPFVTQTLNCTAMEAKDFLSFLFSETATVQKTCLQ